MKLENHAARGDDGRMIARKGKVMNPKEGPMPGKGRTATGRSAASASQSIKETGAHKLLAKAKGHAPKPY